MIELEERIRRDGTVKAGNVLKVDAFLNHQCDVELFDHMGAAWAEHFAGKPVDKILTIESSGIGIACCVARHFANGCALRGLIEICEEAGAQVTGIGIAIEKGFQPGGRELREDGYDLDSLAIVTSMNHETGEIEFA